MAAHHVLRSLKLKELAEERADCRVEILGKNNPKRINYKGVYIPLPEYGISLWFDDRIDDRK